MGFHQGMELPRMEIKRPESKTVNAPIVLRILDTDSSTDKVAEAPPISVATQPGLIDTTHFDDSLNVEAKRVISIFNAALLIE